VRETRDNPLYLPGIALSPKINFQENPDEAIQDAECVVIAVPSKFFRDVTSQFSAFDGLAVSVTKGIEYETGLTMSGLLKTTMPKAAAAALSGPTLALEVARGIPAAIVAAHPQPETAQRVQALFGRPAFRVYTSHGCGGRRVGRRHQKRGGAGRGHRRRPWIRRQRQGRPDHARFGRNAAAGRGARRARGDFLRPERIGRPGGDVLFAPQPQPRLRRAGGPRRESGVHSGRHAQRGRRLSDRARGLQLARKLRIETPIIDEVHAMLYEGKKVRRAVQDLMSREAEARRLTVFAIPLLAIGVYLSGFALGKPFCAN
jgi:glycerol-3-phosphate dehydrogenase (NAD(P)+)